MADPVIRRRRDADLPVLIEILGRQQAETHYPLRWPWPGDVAEFLRRPDEIDAWVAEVDGTVAGHVAIQTVSDDEIGRLWSSAHGVPVTKLIAVGVLFSDRRFARRGIGSALLAQATQRALSLDGAPVLDVVAGHLEPLALYLKRGWIEVGRARPDWLPESEDAVCVMILPRANPAEQQSGRS